MSTQQKRSRFPAYPELDRIPSPRGQVVLIDRIGKGNFGSVYQGTLTGKQGKSAIKIVPLKADELTEILLEVYILKNCSHENIVELMGVFLQGEDLWICMDYCSGGSVDALYRELPKAVAEDVIAVLMYGCLQGLDYLHKNNYIHRDIKAGNLLLTETGILKLADFGVSASLKEHGRARTFIGTPYWMAPEIIACDESTTATYDNKVDIWAVGITTIEIADKNPPLSDIHPMRALTLIPTADLGLAKPKNWSKSMIEFVAVCLCRDPTKRPDAVTLLTHPFIQKNAGNLKPAVQASILMDFIAKAFTARARRKAGPERGDGDDEEGSAALVPTPVAAQKPAISKEAAPPKVGKAPKIPIAIVPPIAPSIVPSKSDAGLVEIAEDEADEANQFVDDKYQPNPGVELEVTIVAGPIKEEILCGDFLNPSFLLLGSERGLSVVELTSKGSATPVQIIRGVRFRQIRVLEDYGVMIAVAGKNSHVRSYKLSSLIKLLNYILKGSSTAGEDQDRTSGTSTRSRKASQDTKNDSDISLISVNGGQSLAINTEKRESRSSESSFLALPSPLLPVSPVTPISPLQQLSTRIQAHNQRRRTSFLPSSSPSSAPTSPRIGPEGSPGSPAYPRSDGNADDLYRFLHAIDIREPDHVLATRWVADFTKVLATKDTICFDIQQTVDSVHMAVLFKQDIVLYEWAREPYLKFMKIKAFWLPEQPRFISLNHDGRRPTYLVIGYSSEANAIRIEDAAVNEIPVPDSLKAIATSGNARWQTFDQLNNPADIKIQITNPLRTLNKKAALMGMATSSRGGQKSSKPRFYLSTYGTATIVVDGAVKPVTKLPEFKVKTPYKRGSIASDKLGSATSVGSGNTVASQSLPIVPAPAPIYRWSAPPTTMLTVWGNNAAEPRYIIAFLDKSGLEVCNWRTGEKMEALRPGAPVRFLSKCEDGRVFLMAGKPKKPCNVYMIK